VEIRAEGGFRRVLSRSNSSSAHLASTSVSVPIETTQIYWFTGAVDIAFDQSNLGDIVLEIIF